MESKGKSRPIAVASAIGGVVISAALGLALSGNDDIELEMAFSGTEEINVIENESFMSFEKTGMSFKAFHEIANYSKNNMARYVDNVKYVSGNPGNAGAIRGIQMYSNNTTAMGSFWSEKSVCVKVDAVLPNMVAVVRIEEATDVVQENSSIEKPFSYASNVDSFGLESGISSTISINGMKCDDFFVVTYKSYAMESVMNDVSCFKISLMNSSKAYEELSSTASEICDEEPVGSRIEEERRIHAYEVLLEEAEECADMAEIDNSCVAIVAVNENASIERSFSYSPNADPFVFESGVSSTMSINGMKCDDFFVVTRKSSIMESAANAIADLKMSSMRSNESYEDLPSGASEICGEESVNSHIEEERRLLVYDTPFGESSETVHVVSKQEPTFAWTEDSMSPFAIPAMEFEFGSRDDRQVAIPIDSFDFSIKQFGTVRNVDNKISDVEFGKSSSIGSIGDFSARYSARRFKHVQGTSIYASQIFPVAWASELYDASMDQMWEAVKRDHDHNTTEVTIDFGF